MLPLAAETLPQLAAVLATAPASGEGAAQSRAQLCCYLVAKTLHRCVRAYLPTHLGAAFAAAAPAGPLPTLLKLLEVRERRRLGTPRSCREQCGCSIARVLFFGSPWLLSNTY